MTQLYRGAAPKQDYAQLLSMMDEVFFAKDTQIPPRNFLTLLPKLYKEEYDPCRGNFVVKEGDSICATVGIYYNSLFVGGKQLKTAGIGNVAVATAHRSKGYMKDCMQQAMADMRAQQADISFLGGQRQRYGYFGFEIGGVIMRFDVDKTNIRHVFGKAAESGLELRQLCQDDLQTIDAIEQLRRRVPPYMQRPQAQAYDIMCSWGAIPYAAYDGARFAGYFIIAFDGGVSELMAVEQADVARLAMAAVELADGAVHITVSPYDKQTAAGLYPLCESFRLEHGQRYNVCSYQNVVQAFLQEVANGRPLCDGSITLRIQKEDDVEQIRIHVAQNKVQVSPCSGPADLELAHLEAMQLLFALDSEKRSSLPANIDQWLPIPLFIYSCDNV